MNDRLLLSHATVLDPDGLRSGQDVLVHGGRIVRVAPAGSVDRAGAVVHDCADRLLVPSFVNVHHHFYAGLLRGAPAPPALPASQRERLERVVWPFERRLTRDDVRAGVRRGLLEAVTAGTTTIVDHHVSASCISGVLDLIAEELDASGLRGVLCYEITDRDGPTVARAGLEETERFLGSRSVDGERVRGMVGLHAMGTVGPETLEEAIDLAHRFAVGTHVHLGESHHDNETSVSRYGARPVARLDSAGALGPRSLVAHAVHVHGDEVAILARHAVLVAHNPRSNAMNGVGLADLVGLRTAGLTIGVGGDGFTQDIRAELELLPLLQRQHRCDPRVLPPHDAVEIVIAGNAEIARRLGGWDVGRVAVGYLADLILFDYDPLAPLETHNALWHLSCGLPGALIRDVWVGGVLVLRHGEPTTLDAERIREESRASIARLWALQRAA